MRLLTRQIDVWLRKSHGIFNLNEDETCLLRLQITTTSHELRFPHSTIPAREPALALHLWNEHIPALPPTGSTVAWAVQMQRLFVQSLHILARRMRMDPSLADVRALGGKTAVLAYGGHDSGEHFVRRLGFTIMPCRKPLGRFGEFWENLYAWWLMDAFNPASLKGRDFFSLRRTEFWIPADVFLDRYDPRGGQPE